MDIRYDPLICAILRRWIGKQLPGASSITRKLQGDRIYADIIGRPMKISRSEQTPALGAGLFAAVAAGRQCGGHDSVQAAQKAMTGTRKVFQPVPEHHQVYQKLYRLYCQLHDGFGVKQWSGSMYNVMKDLLELRNKVMKEK